MFRLSSKIFAATSDIYSSTLREFAVPSNGTLLKILSLEEIRKLLPDRTILKDRDAKPLIEDLRRLPNQQHLTHKARVEIEAVKDVEIVFVDGVPIAFRKKNELIPVLTNKGALDSMPRIVVDMGAVPHVAGGADIMAPGIRNIAENVLEKHLLVVLDEKHGKYLAVGRALLDAGPMRATKHGKVVVNLHYVGDPIWEAIKPKGPGS